MRAEELRIGNLIIDGFGDIRCVAGFHTGYILLECPSPPQQSNVNPTDAIGVNISEEWLYKFGFVCSPSTQNKEKNYFNGNKYVSINVFNGSGFRLNINYQIYNGTEIKYIHQLQNLYFALTQTEL